MSELVAFLEARLAEDEAVAREAGPDGGEWFCRYPEQPDCHMAGEFGWFVSGPGVETEDTEWGKVVADHIARHDPARVLREVTAKRAILAIHGRAYQYNPRATPSCETCVNGDDVGDPDAFFPCPTLRALALPFSDHPDFQEQWR